MPNRLAKETSPYLLQHKDNPVDWYPWGQEAFDRARSEDRPIFLSIGYSSCHWCHVMEHESFENEEMARLMNDSFVCVKVDREERPDVDEAYMTAVQLSTGRGGWPMSVFLTPDRKPFFAGTYFPREDRGGAAGFRSILTQIANLWKGQREELIQSADSFAAALRETLGGRSPGTFDKLEQKLIDDCVRSLVADFDSKNGGFGGAPKFPPHSAIEFLLTYAVSQAAPEDLRQAALGMACFTLERMALGGIHDHVGGGFHRYSTDERWLLPHFEKMLYDNALMLRNYSLAAGLVREADRRLSNLYVWTSHDIVGWVAREMTSPEGLFYSAIDADSEGEEGKYYVWSVDEVRSLVPGAEPFLNAYNFAEEGNFRDEATGAMAGTNIPHLTEDAEGAYSAILDTLLQARESRVRPGLDDKALVGWNGLMIGALAEAGAINLALKAAEAVLAAERRLGHLPRQITKGSSSGRAYLEDYAYLVDGLLRLSTFLSFLEENRDQVRDLPEGATSSAWRSEAKRLADEMVRLFWDDEQGGFFATSSNHEFLFGRTKPVFDQPTPSGNAVAIHALTELGESERARSALESLLGWMQRAPQATEALHLAAMSLVPKEAVPQELVEKVTAEVAVEFAPKEARVGSTGEAEFLVRLSIPDGIHLNGPNPPARWLTPTRVVVKGVESRIDYPPAPNDQYVGEVAIPISLSLGDSREGAEFEATVSWQACTETECLLPKEETFSGVVYR